MFKIKLSNFPLYIFTRIYICLFPCIHIPKFYTTSFQNKIEITKKYNNCILNWQFPRSSLWAIKWQYHDNTKPIFEERYIFGYCSKTEVMLFFQQHKKLIISIGVTTMKYKKQNKLRSKCIEWREDIYIRYTILQLSVIELHIVVINIIT